MLQIFPYISACTLLCSHTQSLVSFLLLPQFTLLISQEFSWRDQWRYIWSLLQFWSIQLNYYCCFHMFSCLRIVQGCQKSDHMGIICHLLAPVASLTTDITAVSERNWFKSTTQNNITNVWTHCVSSASLGAHKVFPVTNLKSVLSISRCSALCFDLGLSDLFWNVNCTREEFCWSNKNTLEWR